MEMKGIEAKETAPEILGGETDPLSLENILRNIKQDKKHAQKGYIRAKVKNGTKYWYYCMSVKVKKGIYRERCVHLGTPETILVAVLTYRKFKKKSNNGENRYSHIVEVMKEEK